MSEREQADWREAARARMHEATLAELRGRLGSEDVSFNYRWEHITTVVTLALRLAELTGADVEIVEAAAWLHDICKFSDGEAHPRCRPALHRQDLDRRDGGSGSMMLNDALRPGNGKSTRPAYVNALRHGHHCVFPTQLSLARSFLRSASAA